MAPGIFENEHAIDTACSMASEIVTEILKTHENPTEEEIEKYEESPEYKALAYGTGSPDEEHLAILARLREKLDSGLGDQMMSKYRGLFERPSTWGEQGVYKYAYFIIGVLLMSTGARIRDEDQELLRQVVEEVGHIGPSGWVQFWAALDVYTPGFPRNFWEISCYRCGKTETDLGRPLLRCDICDHEDVAYCDTVCINLMSCEVLHGANCYLLDSFASYRIASSSTVTFTWATTNTNSSLLTATKMKCQWMEVRRMTARGSEMRKRKMRKTAMMWTEMVRTKMMKVNLRRLELEPRSENGSRVI
jgi:hypothetical protein